MACILETNGPMGLNFGMVVYDHEWKIFCSVSVHQKGQGHRSQVTRKSRKPCFGLYFSDLWDNWNGFWYCSVYPCVDHVLFFKCLGKRSRSPSKVILIAWEILVCLSVRSFFLWWLNRFEWFLVWWCITISNCQLWFGDHLGDQDHRSKVVQ